MAVVALVFGILCVCTCWWTTFPWCAIIFGTIAIVMGAVGRKNPEKKGMATAGMVLGIIGVAVILVFWLACAACVGAALSM